MGISMHFISNLRHCIQFCSLQSGDASKCWSVFLCRYSLRVCEDWARVERLSALSQVPSQKPFFVQLANLLLPRKICRRDAFLYLCPKHRPVLPRGGSGVAGVGFLVRTYCQQSSLRARRLAP